MYAYAKKYITSAVWQLYPVNIDMIHHDTIIFDSGDEVNVFLYFVDVTHIEKSMENLYQKLQICI